MSKSISLNDDIKYFTNLTISVYHFLMINTEKKYSPRDIALNLHNQDKSTQIFTKDIAKSCKLLYRNGWVGQTRDKNRNNITVFYVRYTKINL